MSSRRRILRPPHGPRLHNPCQTTRALLPASIQSGVRSDDSAFGSPTEIRIRKRAHFTPHHVYMGPIKHILSIHSAAPHLTGYSLPTPPLPRLPPPHTLPTLLTRLLFFKLLAFTPLASRERLLAEASFDQAGTSRLITHRYFNARKSA